MLGEPTDSVNVRLYGSLGVIAALEFLERHFSKLGHRDLLVTHTIRSRFQPLASTTRSVLPANRPGSGKYIRYFFAFIA